MIAFAHHIRRKVLAGAASAAVQIVLSCRDATAAEPAADIHPFRFGASLDQPHPPVEARQSNAFARSGDRRRPSKALDYKNGGVREQIIDQRKLGIHLWCGAIS